MKRTRKWAFVEQEAKRLVDLGLSAKAIGARLEVNETTVRRWLQSGKLVRPSANRVPVTVAVRPDQTPAQWAAEVRAAYALDATDEQLVSMGEAALLLTRDTNANAQLRLQAMGRFQAVVKQLSLVARATAEQSAPVAQKPKLRVVRRSGGDPRRGMMASA